MAQAKRKSSNGGNGPRTRNTGDTRGSRRAGGDDAIALLKTDHREVEGYFEAFEKARSDDRKLGALGDDQGAFYGFHGIGRHAFALTNTGLAACPSPGFQQGFPLKA